MSDGFPKDRVARWALFGTIGLLGLGLARVAQLEVAPAEELSDRLGSRTRSTQRLHMRGTIVDRRGNTLATSVLGHNLAIDLKYLCEKAVRAGILDPGFEPDDPRRLELLRKVAGLIHGRTGIAEDELFERMKDAEADSQYLPLVTGLDTDQLHPSELSSLAIDFAGMERPVRIHGLVLEERPIRKTLDLASIAPLVGAVQSVGWRPTENELDRVPSDLAVDVPGFLDWAGREVPRMGDPLDALARELAEALLPDPLDRGDLERLRRGLLDRLEGTAGETLLLLPADQLDAADRRRIRRIAFEVDSGGEDEPAAITEVVPRRLLLRYADPVMLESLMARYPVQRGASGIEYVLDETLRPRHGSLERTVAVGGDTLFVGPDGYERGRDGEHVQITIDLAIQQIVERHLRTAIEDHLAVGGWAIVADPLTGEILAAVDILDNDEAEARTGWVAASLDGDRDDLGPAHGRNRIWTDTYEPGSTFKSIFWAWARELGRNDPAEPVDIGAHGSTRFGSRTIEYVGNADRLTDWRTCLLKSINTGFATVAGRMSNQELVEMCDRFGVGLPTGVMMPAEGRSPVDPKLLESPTGERLSMSFGYSVALTPLQLVRAYCPIARNDGRLPRMTLVSPDIRMHEAAATPALSPAIARETRAVLAEQFDRVRDRLVKEGREGTPYRAWGKSGTAYMPRGDADGNHAGYHKAPLPPRYLSSYIAGAPFDDPRIIVAMGIQDPKPGEGANAAISFRGAPTGHFGSYSAGRPVHHVLTEVLQYLGVPADRQDDSSG
ncbi:MAG: penicillin-binding transpeptidase domain-containing protein [Planctomycetota bacterium]|nr:penicillin-binding transpeptidase domain-containing protein [Planctomycetota bacterium]